MKPSLSLLSGVMVIIAATAQIQPVYGRDVRQTPHPLPRKIMLSIAVVSPDLKTRAAFVYR